MRMRGIDVSVVLQVLNKAELVQRTCICHRRQLLLRVCCAAVRDATQKVKPREVCSFDFFKTFS